ncbi:ELMO domain-containing protein 2-like [Mytilus edulis]|uniref:ELMO domain-containing protein 2-like n=1 Tax=Mytilus edulis TaxID=6550 RepID=UPI0039EF9A90
MWKGYLHQTWVSFYFSVLWPMWKWILRKWTGKCELLRITSENPKGAKRTKAIERSLKHSNIAILKQLSKDEIIDVIPASEEVMKIKDVIAEIHPQFAYCFQVCLCQICGYKRLFAEVEEMRKTQYSSENPDHEEKLMQLWGFLMPDIKLETRISKQWTDIGFQGDDPKTDFRGMGMLGLNQLLYISSKYTALSRQILSKSHHPTLGFSYAIVGINLTSVLYELLKKQTLRTHFYNIKDDKPSLHDFHELYCYMFKEFVTFWFNEKPKDIMEFGRVRDKFRKKIKQKLKEDLTTILKFDADEELAV